MPKGTKVHKAVDAMVKRGMPKSRAIAIAQASTGQSYKTGRKLKTKRRSR